MLSLIVHSDITPDDTIGEGRIYARPDSPLTQHQTTLLAKVECMVGLIVHSDTTPDDIIGEGRMYARSDSPVCQV